MKFVLITGPQAVGKMTVGKAIAEKTGLKLFHNHMTIELVLQLFDFSSKEAKHLIHHFRAEIFKAMAGSEEKGMIFTYLWAFDLESEYQYVNEVMRIFEEQGAKTYIVELESTLASRLVRNKTPLRLAEKPTKRNLEWSENELLTSLEKYRLNSLPGEIQHENYLRIDNTDLTPDACADLIVQHFSL